MIWSIAKWSWTERNDWMSSSRSVDALNQNTKFVVFLALVVWSTMRCLVVWRRRIYCFGPKTYQLPTSAPWTLQREQRECCCCSFTVFVKIMTVCRQKDTVAKQRGRILTTKNTPREGKSNDGNKNQAWRPKIGFLTVSRNWLEWNQMTETKISPQK